MKMSLQYDPRLCVMFLKLQSPLYLIYLTPTDSLRRAPYFQRLYFPAIKESLLVGDFEKYIFESNNKIIYLFVQ
jgi:hypothetical protein